MLESVRPLLDRLGAVALPPEQQAPGDVPLRWDGRVVAVVRLPEAPSIGDLGQIIADVETELESPLAQLSRAGKQRAVRVLEERGAFSFRRSVEAVAKALGVSRFTVYNYLNREDPPQG